MSFELSESSAASSRAVPPAFGREDSLHPPQNRSRGFFSHTHVARRGPFHPQEHSYQHGRASLSIGFSLIVFIGRFQVSTSRRLWLDLRGRVGRSSPPAGKEIPFPPFAFCISSAVSMSRFSAASHLRAANPRASASAMSLSFIISVSVGNSKMPNKGLMIDPVKHLSFVSISIHWLRES